MQFRGLDLNLLVALDALLHEESVTAAGHKVHRSQSSMSAALARLRAHFRDPLLLPMGRRMRRSPYAEQLVAQVRSILLQIDITMHASAPFDPRTSQRRIKISASDYAVELLLLEARRIAAAQAPGLILDIVPVTQQSVTALHHGEIDLLILPDRYRDSSLPSANLFVDRLVCVIDREEASAADTIDLDRFKAAQHVLFQPDPGHMIAFDRWLQEHYRFVPAVRLLLPNYAALPRAVVGTSLIATVPERLARRYVTLLPIKILRPKFRTPPLVEVMQWHSATADDQGLLWLRTIIADTARAFTTSAPKESSGRRRNSRDP